MCRPSHPPRTRSTVKIRSGRRRRGAWSRHRFRRSWSDRRKPAPQGSLRALDRHRPSRHPLAWQSARAVLSLQPAWNAFQAAQRAGRCGGVSGASSWGRFLQRYGHQWYRLARRCRDNRMTRLGWDCRQRAEAEVVWEESVPFLRATTMPNANNPYCDLSAGEYAAAVAAVDLSHLYRPSTTLLPAASTRRRRLALYPACLNHARSPQNSV